MTKNYLLALLISCLSVITGWSQTCNTPTALTVSQITATSALFSWTNSGPATQWDVLLLPIGTPEPNNTTIPTFVCNTNPFVVTGLNPCTSYKYYVRSACSPTDSSNWSQAMTFTTLGAPTCSFAVTIGFSADTPTSMLFAQVSAGTAPYSYQWSLNGVPIPSATSNTLNVMGQYGVYTVTVTDATNATVSASAQVTGIPVTAYNDNITIYPGSTSITTSAASVLSNDYLNNYPINPNTPGNSNSYTNIIITPVNIPSGFTINPNGTISVLPGTATGTYTLAYSIASVQSPTYNSAVATATVIVAGEGFLLNAFLDANNNGTQDANEANFNLGNFQYQLNNGTINTAVSSNGMYYIQESNAANSYNFSFIIDGNYSAQYAVSPSTYNNVSVTPGTGVAFYNFPVTQLPYTDATVNVIPYGAPPRPGFTYKNMISYTNRGNQPIASGTLTFTKPNAVSITTVSQVGTTSTASGFTYDFTNLLPNETRTIIITMQVPTIPTVNLNDLLTCTVMLTNISSDINANNNTYSMTQIVVGSYDPNNKTEAHGGKIVHSNFTSNDYLTYTIQFENTGNYYAENVRINDVLDVKLDENSVKMVNASHPFLLTRTGTALNWNFNGIDLQPAAKGQVTFQIKPKPGYAIGDIIPNTANIYFDFNPAIVTNTYNTEFVSAMSVSEFDSSSLAVYPNPTKGFLTIASKNATTLQTVTVMDVLGKTVLRNNIAATQTTVDVSHLMSGIYFLTVEANEQRSTVKIVKQ